MTLAPIILFCYNRPEHTQKTIDALKRNELAKESIIYIFLDGPQKEQDKEKIRKVERIIEHTSGFKQVYIYKSNKNKGLANSVIRGVTQIINKYGKVIVLEDDIITSNKFLLFMNEALNFYQNNNKIYSIGGYNLPIKIPESYDQSIYLSFRTTSWGWGTWKDRWEKIDWHIKDYSNFNNNRREIDNFKLGGDDLPKMLQLQLEGKIDSWAIRWAYNQYKVKQYTILPIKSLVRNVGFDNSGVHCDESDKYDIKLEETFEWEFTNDLQINDEITNNIRTYVTPQSGNDLNDINLKKVSFMEKWVSSLIDDKCISNSIINVYNVKEVSIYGCGTIGIRIYNQLIKENILKVNYFVDKNPNEKLKNIKCININEYLKQYKKDELLIVSVFYHYNEIEKNIKDKLTSIKITSIEEFI